MKIRTLGYYFRQSFRSMGRNGWMSIAAISTVAIAIFIVGIFTLLVMNADFIADRLESEIEICAFVEPETPRDQVMSLQEQVQYLPGVASVSLVPKEEGLAWMHSKFGQNRDLLGALDGENPLPDYFIVKARDPQEVGSVASALERLPRIYKVSYGKQEVETLFSILGYVRLGGTAVILLLVGASIFLIATTVRLTVFARRREIQIMKLVGATDWFIRWPFLLEGLVLGSIGALVAATGIYFLYDFLIQSISPKVPFLPLISDYRQIYQVLWKLLAGGAMVGAMGSAISIRKFLRV
ncbi:MAG TPA: ABC transporter permease [Clostridia bacterium]|nr:ABC transporter permease [Clostridia bacterium]